jgi:non-ribosomal peptide synthetase-like protein
MLADGVYMGEGIGHAGRFSNAKRSLGSRVFVGNNPIISPTTNEIFSDTTIGNNTFAPAAPKGQHIYLGSPAFEMPKPLKSEERADQFEQQPLYMDIARASHNILKIGVPRGLNQSIGLFLLWLFLGVCPDSSPQLSAGAECWQGWAWSPLISLGGVAMYAVIPLILKWLLVGKYGAWWLFFHKPALEHPMWSSWMWRDEIHYECAQMTTKTLDPFIGGTPLLPAYMRMMGAKIGARPLILSTCMSEFDLVTIGENFIGEGFIQPHSFEGRVYQLGKVKIGNNCSVGKLSTVMHSTELEDGVAVGDLTLIMKGEVCHKNGQYDGLPSQAL